MGKLVKLKDGDLRHINTVEDAFQVIEEKLGGDFAIYLNECFTEMDDIISSYQSAEIDIMQEVRDAVKESKSVEELADDIECILDDVVRYVND